VSKEPCIHTKEPYISETKPRISAKYAAAHGEGKKKKRQYSTTVPTRVSKMPCISAKEPLIPTKEP